MFLLSLLPLLTVGVLGADGPVTIDGGDAYKQQRNCAAGCFVKFNDVGYPIAMEISCPTFRVQNDCFCRPDLQQEANLYISSCVNRGCSQNAHDISLATKIYDDYCTGNGYTRQAEVTAPSPTGALTITITSPPTATVTETVTVTAGSGSPSLRPNSGVSFAPLVVAVLVSVFGGFAFAQ